MTKPKNEFEIFRKFVRICPHNIAPGSITVRNSPEPRILCRKADGQYLAFEMVKGIDRSLASSILESYELANAFHNGIGSLEDDKAHEINSRFAGCSINVVFRKKEYLYY